MRIFIDADAVPVPIKEILYRAAGRNRIFLVLVANQPVKAPRSEFISCVTVPAGPDEADHRIVDMLEAGDLVVTADIPLADRVAEKGGYAIDPRGTLYTLENIKERLAVRNLMDDLRGMGMATGGPSAFSLRDRREFANQLDRFLSKHNENRERR